MKPVYLIIFSLISLSIAQNDIVLDFTPFQLGESVMNYFAGGYGSMGTGPGPNFGIIFNDGPNGIPGYVIDLSNPPEEAFSNPMSSCGTGLNKGYFKTGTLLSSGIFTSYKSFINTISITTTLSMIEETTDQISFLITPLAASAQPYLFSDLVATDGCNSFSISDNFTFDGGALVMNTYYKPAILTIEFQYKADPICQEDPLLSLQDDQIGFSFEGLDLYENVKTFFNGGFGSFGSQLQGRNYGLNFTSERGRNGAGLPCPDTLTYIGDQGNCLCTMKQVDNTIANFNPVYVLQGAGCNAEMVVDVTSNYRISEVIVYAEHYSSFTVSPTASQDTFVDVNKEGTCSTIHRTLLQPSKTFSIKTTSVDVASISRIILTLVCDSDRILDVTSNPPRCNCPDPLIEVGGNCIEPTDPPTDTPTEAPPTDEPPTEAPTEEPTEAPTETDPPTESTVYGNYYYGKNDDHGTYKSHRNRHKVKPKVNPYRTRTDSKEDDPSILYPYHSGNYGYRKGSQIKKHEQSDPWNHIQQLFSHSKQMDDGNNDVVDYSDEPEPSFPMMEDADDYGFDNMDDFFGSSDKGVKSSSSSTSYTPSPSSSPKSKSKSKWLF
eukprot:TRINITY_DN391_c0_g1_i6.p1 TRINITY_DN391_c0_g1~~TRINITY_DN391_c0_g1_i6.p1  ORF type:complete len:605 (-),score=148.13 TRINITY_DN391_c0_g1_i6:74-1888(-)